MMTPETLSEHLRASNRLPSGWAALDALLDGGWPLGKLVEIRGQGCTSLALGAVRQAQAQAHSGARDLPIAWIDGAGAFCPATACVDPTRLTLVQTQAVTRVSDAGAQPRSEVLRGRQLRHAPAGPALFAADILLRSRSYALLVLDLPARRPPPMSAWFRLARLAARAHTALLLLHPLSGTGSGTALSGSASGLLVDVRLCPAEGPAWSEWAPPDLELRLLRTRAGETGDETGDETGILPPLRLPARG